MDKISPEEILVEGSGNKLTVESSETDKPMVIRGVIKKQHADNCVRDNRDYWYIELILKFPQSTKKVKEMASH